MTTASAPPVSPARPRRNKELYSLFAWTDRLDGPDRLTGWTDKCLQRSSYRKVVLFLREI